MAFDQPLTFRPLFMERVWGGRRLADRLGKALPEGKVIGESWELVDRPEAQSVVAEGAHAGMSLHELWTKHRDKVFGDVPAAPRFPLLAKILDARETLSVQVHPPASVAEELGGEPKTEVWCVLEAEKGAELFAGFRAGVNREAYDRAVQTGEIERLLHRIPVHAGDVLFIPSGRCHAIGAGCLIVEIQQNGDTTYRVFDWNRVGLDGEPRPLHLEASRRSIDFADYEPALAAPDAPIECEHFSVRLMALDEPVRDEGEPASLFTVFTGAVECGPRVYHRGEFFLLPVNAKHHVLSPRAPGTTLLRTTLPPKI